MGQCVASGRETVGPKPTAKLILDDGTLKEFDRPVQASSAVDRRDGWNRWFVCDADEMEFDRSVSAVGPDEWLRPGQIYFVLPRPMLNSPLQGEELARLAVKASAALMMAPLAFGEPREEEMKEAAVPVAGERRRRRRRRRRSPSGRGRNFEPDLCAIQE